MSRWIRRHSSSGSSVLSNEDTLPDLNPWNTTSLLPDYYNSDCSIITKLPKDNRFIPVPVNFTIPGEAYHPADPLDPPPVQFSRALIPTSCSRNNYFRPISIFSLSTDLCQGILPLYPVALFPQDIWQEDWVRFIEDLVISARYPGVPSRHWPASHRRYYKRGERYPKAMILIDEWNCHFFNPRGIHVQLKDSKRQPRLFVVSLNQAAYIANERRQRNVSETIRSDGNSISSSSSSSIAGSVIMS